MIDIEKREQKEQEKKKTRQRMQAKVDPNNYEFIPAQKETDYYDNDVNQRVGIYVRVSTDDVRQTTSFELQKKYSALESQIAELEAFKSQIERKEKEDMIDSFYMLSDDDKKEVKENIDSYSLDDIEAKLSIICVRNRVSFNLESESEKTPNMVFNVNSVDSDDDSVPAWIKAVQSYTDKHK